MTGAPDIVLHKRFTTENVRYRLSGLASLSGLAASSCIRVAPPPRFAPPPPPPPTHPRIAPPLSPPRQPPHPPGLASPSSPRPPPRFASPLSNASVVDFETVKLTTDHISISSDIDKRGKVNDM